uniref:Uncharacterized protein n=1 Tax=Ascaris lumbricoides TaxID=6252 RepID=A0A0M3I613_ASCLU
MHKESSPNTLTSIASTYYLFNSRMGKERHRRELHSRYSTETMASDPFSTDIDTCTRESRGLVYGANSQ